MEEALFVDEDIVDLSRSSPDGNTYDLDQAGNAVGNEVGNGDNEDNAEGNGDNEDNEDNAEGKEGNDKDEVQPSVRFNDRHMAIPNGTMHWSSTSKPPNLDKEVNNVGNVGNVGNVDVLDRVQLAFLANDMVSTHTPFDNHPAYMCEIVREMLQNDFLLVLGRGLGLNVVLSLFLDQVKKHAPKALVLVLGRSLDSDDDFGSSESSLSPEEGIGFSTPSNKRAGMYARGGVYATTAPIIVVDILTGVLDPALVSGLVLTRAERIAEHSPSAFAIQLLKSGNKAMFFKALSEFPESLMGRMQLPMRLRVLNVKTIMLYPRFHVHVDESLPQVDIDEVIVELPPLIRRQQALLSELISACLSDIKRRVPHLDVEFVTPVLGIEQPQDNPDVLHSKTSSETLMAAPDLAYRIRNSLTGVWHKLSAACKLSINSLATLQQLQNTLIRFDALTFYAQFEVAHHDPSQPWADLPAADALFVEARNAASRNLQPAKFKHVYDILRTISTDNEASEVSEVNVLIVCSSARTLLELQEFLRKPVTEPTMQSAEEIERFRIKQEEETARREAEIARKREEAKNLNRPNRRRVRGAKQPRLGRDESPSLSIEPEESLESLAPEKDLNAEVEEEFQEELNTQLQLQEPISVNLDGKSCVIVFTTYYSHKPISSYSPNHIIMYDPDLPFTREVERYLIKHTAEVHFMYYQQSVEELQYLTVMRKEKDAFTRLIREKGLMPMVFDDKDDEDANDFTIVGNRRSYQVSAVKPRVVVDMREFRSALPQLIWQHKMEVIPLTLLVGDYVITSDIVVERKSISDLISSFRSGRLYSQCTSMHAHYKTSVLLIEFDNADHFSMEPFKDIRMRKGAKIQREVQENIAALILRFPKLKLIWSASPMHTAQIFKGLKEMEAEPDPMECLKAGQTVMLDSVAVSMLESLPGVTPKNSFLLTQHASNFVELCALPEETVLKALGPENGRKLWDFITKMR